MISTPTFNRRVRNVTPTLRASAPRIRPNRYARTALSSERSLRVEVGDLGRIPSGFRSSPYRVERLSMTNVVAARGEDEVPICTFWRVLEFPLKKRPVDNRSISRRPRSDRRLLLIYVLFH